MRIEPGETEMEKKFGYGEQDMREAIAQAKKMGIDDQEEICSIARSIFWRRYRDNAIEQRKKQLGLAKEAVYLNVDFDHKDLAKAAGARWDKTERMWFAPAGAKLEKFWDWLPEDMKRPKPYIFLVEGSRECYKCHQRTRIIAFGIPEMSDEENEPAFDFAKGYSFDKLSLIPRLEVMPRELRDFCETEYGYRRRPSRATGLTLYNNTCQHCDAMQGENFLFEVSGPFFIRSKEDLERLRFFKIDVPYISGSTGVFDDWGGASLSFAMAHAESLDLKIFEPILFSPYE